MQRVAEINIDFWNADWALAADTRGPVSGIRRIRRAIRSAFDRGPSGAIPAVAVMGHDVAPNA